MLLNRLFHGIPGYKMPDFWSLTGLSAFNETLIDMRAHSSKSSPIMGPISDTGLRRLLELVYYASQLPDEGRYPRFSVVNREPSELYKLLRFREPVALKLPDDLRRLGATCCGRGRALLVVEDGERLCTLGLDRVGPMGYQWPFVGHPGIGGVGRGSEVHVEVRGPGHICVTFPSFGLVTRGGSIAPTTLSIAALEPVNVLLREAEKELPPGSAGLLGALLSEAVLVAVDGGRGGSFLVLPPGHTEPGLNLGLDVKYDVSDLSLFDVVREYGELSLARSEDRDVGRIVRARERMMAVVDTLASVSHVDGCVVLNRRLELRAFGVEIRIRDEEARSGGRTFRDRASGDESDYDAVMKELRGTRHRSAARFCLAHPGTIAIIVSQDKELKVLWSDDRHLYGCRDVNAEHHVALR